MNGGLVLIPIPIPAAIDAALLRDVGRLTAWLERQVRAAERLVDYAIMVAGKPAPN